MKKVLTILVLACGNLALAAPPEGKTQYITDEVTATLRDAPRNDATIKGLFKSGTRITVLETLGPDSFAHVRMEDGRDGWIPTRLISNTPAAKDRLSPLQVELNQARERVKALEKDLTQTKEDLAKALPALELAADNEKLKALVAEKEQAGADLQRRYSDEESRRKTLMTGGGLVVGGAILGLVLPLLRRGQRRRGGF